MYHFSLQNNLLVIYNLKHNPKPLVVHMRPISTALFFFSIFSQNIQRLCSTGMEPPYSIPHGCASACLLLLLQIMAALGGLPPATVLSSWSKFLPQCLHHPLCSFLLHVVICSTGPPCHLPIPIYSGLRSELPQCRDSDFIFLQYQACRLGGP